MITITGYKQLNYSDFQSALQRALTDCGKNTMEVAIEINVKSQATALNAFNQYKQKVSDATLTTIMDVVGLKGFVHWQSGTRYYYIKNGK